MHIDGWRYYNHAALPDTPPHMPVNMEPIKDGSIWSIHEGCYLARWITDFDCLKETKWWYVIKDSPFDVNELKSKRRYEINKGKRNYCVKEIDATSYKKDIYQIQNAAYAEYPIKYRPTVDCERLYQEIDSWSQFKVFGAFSKTDNVLDGYALLKCNNECIDYYVHKVKPDVEKLGINAALVEFILESFNEEIKNGSYICDGARNISHETHFQDYLEKYFGFRKAYCVLHVKYTPLVTWAVKFLYPFRRLMFKLDGIRAVHKINGILQMEDIVRG